MKTNEDYSRNKALNCILGIPARTEKQSRAQKHITNNIIKKHSSGLPCDLVRIGYKSINSFTRADFVDPTIDFECMIPLHANECLRLFKARNIYKNQNMLRLAFKNLSQGQEYHFNKAIPSNRLEELRKESFLFKLGCIDVLTSLTVYPLVDIEDRRIIRESTFEAYLALPNDLQKVIRKVSYKGTERLVIEYQLDLPTIDFGHSDYELLVSLLESARTFPMLQQKDISSSVIKVLMTLPSLLDDYFENVPAFVPETIVDKAEGSLLRVTQRGWYKNNILTPEGEYAYCIFRKVPMYLRTSLDLTRKTEAPPSLSTTKFWQYFMQEFQYEQAIELIELTLDGQRLTSRQIEQGVFKILQRIQEKELTLDYIAKTFSTDKWGAKTVVDLFYESDIIPRDV